MDAQELKRACELAFLVAREGVEQDPPIDPPASMRMFLYVREFPQRALTVARQVLAEDEEFRHRVAARATADDVGELALAWLNQRGVLDAEELSIGPGAPEPTPAEAHSDGPVTKESIRSDLDELKSLVGQLSEERMAVDHEVQDLERALSEPAPPEAAVDPGVIASASSSLVAQVRSLHADLKTARAERDHAQESKELAIIEQAELAAQLDEVRSLAASTESRLGELESQIAETTAARQAAEAERQALEAERAELVARADSMEGERDQVVAEKEAIARERVAVEERLAAADGDIARLNAELDDARTNAGASVSELRAALAASEALGAHVDQLTIAQRAGRLEMERINTALADQTMSSAEKISLLEAALNQVVVERDALAGKLELVRAAVSSVQTEVATLDSTVSDVEHTAGALGSRVQDLRTSVGTLPTEPIAPADLSVLDTPEPPELADLAAELERDVVVEATAESASDEPPSPSDQPLFLSDTATIVDTEPAEETAAGEPAPEAGLVAEPSDTGIQEPSMEEAPAPGGEASLPEDGPDASAQLQPSVSEVPPSEAEFGGFDNGETAGGAPVEETREDLDEVHALVAETVASFEPGDDDALPGARLDAESAARSVGSPASTRGGLASLFSSFVPSSEPASADTAHEATSPEPPGEAEALSDTTVLVDPALGDVLEADQAEVIPRSPVEVPPELSDDPVAVARHVVNTEDAVLLVDGDPVAAMGWPSVDRVDQRRNLVHFLHALAGSSGVAPDVLLDRDNGTDRLPDSRTVRVRVTDEAGSVAAQILTLIDSYPAEWPVVVVTDDKDLASEAAMKGATILDNGQLLDLFIAS